MDAAEWNATYPIGTEVVLTLNNGAQYVTTTTTAAVRYGGIDHVQIGSLAGYVLLSWVAPVTPD